MRKCIPVNKYVNTYKQNSSLSINKNVKDNNINNINNTINNNIYSPAKAEQIPYEEIIDYLNLKIDAHYKSTTKKTKDSICIII